MSFSIGYGPLTVQRGAEESRSNERLWADSLALAREAEEAGFDSIWVGEHHFTSDGYLSAVFPFLGALAATTDRVMLGTKVLLAPLHHPIRIAEDAAAVQVLSGGRMILGAAVGYREEEFEGFGISLAARASRMREAVKVLRSASAGEPVRIGSGSDRSVLVTPVSAPIPIWLGGAAPAALRRAGEMADGFIAPIGTPAELQAQVQMVDAAAAAVARKAPVVASSSFVVLRHPSLNAERTRQALEGLLGFYSQHKADDPRSRVGRLSDSLPAVIDGSPDEVARRLLEFRDVAGTDRTHHHVVRLEYPGMSRAESSAHLAAFAESVFPTIRQQSVIAGESSPT